MKNRLKIVASMMVLLIATGLQAQKTPKRPKTPKVHKSEHSDETSSSYSYSISTSEDDGQNKGTNVSVSISNSEDSYTFRSKFPSDKLKEIRHVLTKEMSSKNHTVYKGRDSWNSDSNGEEVYKVSLSNGKLSMYLDKDIASASLIEKFETLGVTIRTVIVGKENEERREAERLQREADRIRRDAERMQREADRIQREAKRHASSASNQYKNEAKRIADEARRLAAEARDLNHVAGHNGTIGSVVRKLLGDSKTTYSENTKSVYNWTWPDAQNDLLAAFKKDDFINTENDVVFIKDRTGIHVNGKHLSKNQVAKYNGILEKNKISKAHYFTFYKTNGHIVLVNDNADMEGFMDDADAENLIDKNKKVKLQINGVTAYKNGIKVSTTDLSKLNNILIQNNIIPAPGKIFEIMKRGNYKLGYALSKSSHLGTWQM